MTGSMLEKIKIWKYVLTEKKLGNNSTWIETSPTKALCQLLFQVGYANPWLSQQQNCYNYAEVTTDPYNSLLQTGK
jgi:hypothetical protein